MPCYTPLKAYRADGGGVVFSSKEGFTDRPLELPCGQCVGCRVARSRQWALRIVHESQMHGANSFITLTYDQEHLPEDWSLDVEHWKCFMKALRRRVGKVRYYHCGEYGDENLRPHYHACLFGVDFARDRYRWSGSGDRTLYRSPTLEEAWGRGHALIGNLTFESAAYVARYVVKKRTGPQAEEHYRRINPETGEVHQVKPEYATMSRRPGLGATFFDRYVDDMYPRDEVIHAARRFRPPRFYDERLPEDELLAVKAKRRDAAERHKADLTPERLKTREFVATDRLKRFSPRHI